MSAKNFALIVLVFIFTLIIELVRREKLTFRYAFGWIFAVLLGVVIVLAEKQLFILASFLGFKLLSNFIFFCCMGISVVLGLLLTVLLCQQSQRNECMAKKIAYLEYEIQKFKK